MELTQENVKEILEYRDGILYWKVKRRYGIEPGTVAGYLDTSSRLGRHKIAIKQKSYFRARLVFLIFHGYLPDFVDHIDRNSLNDKIENLRAATKAQNCSNKAPAVGKTSKYLGVYLHYGKYWTAKIVSQGKRLQIGRFKTEALAALAYNSHAVKLHGEFAFLNIITP